MTITTPRARPGGRSERIRESVRKAAQELVAETSRDRITVPMVAERAGVNHSTVYRRWGDISTLLNDLATYHPQPDEALPETSDATEDLRRWANAIAAAYRSDEEAALLRAGAAGAGEATSDCLRDRLDEAARLASRIPGLAGDDVVNHVVAPIIYRVIFLPWTLTDTTATELVNALLEQL